MSPQRLRMCGAMLTDVECFRDLFVSVSCMRVSGLVGCRITLPQLHYATLFFLGHLIQPSFVLSFFFSVARRDNMPAISEMWPGFLRCSQFPQDCLFGRAVELRWAGYRPANWVISSLFPSLLGCATLRLTRATSGAHVSLLRVCLRGAASAAAAPDWIIHRAGRT